MALQTPSMQDLLEAGAHFGHKVSRGNPRMKNFIFGAKDGVHVIDLAQTEDKLKEATQAMYDLGKDGKTMLIVGTKKQAQDIVKDLAQEVGAFYANNKWPGGLLTNFEELRRNNQKLNDLKSQQDKGELSLYTKKEQLLISRRVEKYLAELGGVVNMDKLPNVLFVVDAVSDLIAVKEALRMGITIVGICDSNADPNWFDYPVPANDDGIKSIKLLCETMIKAYGEGKKEAGVQAEKLAQKEADAAAKLKVKEEAESAEATALADQTAALEEQVEKDIVKDSERIV